MFWVHNRHPVVEFFPSMKHRNGYRGEERSPPRTRGWQSKVKILNSFNFGRTISYSLIHVILLHCVLSSSAPSPFTSPVSLLVSLLNVQWVFFFTSPTNSGSVVLKFMQHSGSLCSTQTFGVTHVHQAPHWHATASARVCTCFHSRAHSQPITCNTPNKEERSLLARASVSALHNCCFHKSHLF